MDPSINAVMTGGEPKQDAEEYIKGPLYVVGKQGHYGACTDLVSRKQGAEPDEYGGLWVNVAQGLEGPVNKAVLSTYWMATLRDIEDVVQDFKDHQLPLARIKKVMKADPDVKMISAEAPILFARGCDIFITELTMRAWLIAEENKRRTLQRSDIAMALQKSDMYDFLIDILSRDELPGASRRQTGPPANTTMAPPMHAPQMQTHAHPSHLHQQATHDYYGQEHGAYMHQQHIYAPDPGPYGHAPQMVYDPHQAVMYGSGYSMPSQQMYQSQQGPPQPSHYHQHHEGEGDAEGERDFGDAGVS